MKKQEIEQQLLEKLCHHMYNTPSHSQGAKTMLLYAKKAVEDAEGVLKAAAILDRLQADEAKEMEFYSEGSEDLGGSE